MNSDRQNITRLVLDDFCIEHAAKKRLRESSMEMMSLSDSDETSPALRESEIDLLNHFISSTDFASLRALRPELDGRKRALVELCGLADGTFRISIIE